MEGAFKFQPFERSVCPDEILLRIVKLSALKDNGECDQDFLFHTIGRISKRFKKIAQDKSLWKSGNMRDSS